MSSLTLSELKIAIVTSDIEAVRDLTSILDNALTHYSVVSQAEIKGQLDAFDFVFWNCDQSLFPLRESDLIDLLLPRIALVQNVGSHKLRWIETLGFHMVLTLPLCVDEVLVNMTCALRMHERESRLRSQREALQAKLDCRRFVILAQLDVMKTFSCSEQKAYELLRILAMDSHLEIEELCVRFLGARDKWVDTIKRRNMRRAG
ncbi:ANTAR domain-containing protein [Pseudomonas syringae]|uniref:ANTAR domain-containing protein n=1 Tax=Pseudomonas syringae pv. aceris TaxID=199198 RepID=A0A0P9HBQ4_PSESX|nr:ANTAR domain-containing protein [Pseudomonas syringae]EGH71547.1 hypothetical protein PSYAR_13409 [Pseudomonas syringae pv. aceris str. M302273]KPW09178.1 Uncharacterized protein ALO91_03406 [Pseudomonas syringae pv. aceris]